MSLSKQLTQTRLFTSITEMEGAIADRTVAIQSTEISPTRFDIIKGRLESNDAGQVTYVKKRGLFSIF